MEPNQIHQGEYIAKVLEERRFSQKSLADKINKHRSTVHHILQREKLDLALLEDISEALGIDLIGKFYPDKKFVRPIKAEEPKARYSKNKTSRTTMKLVIDIDPDDPEGISIDFISKLNDMLLQYSKGK